MAIETLRYPLTNQATFSSRIIHEIPRPLCKKEIHEVDRKHIMYHVFLHHRQQNQYQSQYINPMASFSTETTAKDYE